MCCAHLSPRIHSVTFIAGAFASLLPSSNSMEIALEVSKALFILEYIPFLIIKAVRIHCRKFNERIEVGNKIFVPFFQDNHY